MKNTALPPSVSKKTAARYIHHFARLEESYSVVKPVFLSATKDRLRSGRLTMKLFAEKPIDNVASISFCTELEANRGVSGGASHISIQFVTVEKLQKPPTDHLCNDLTSALRYAEVNKSSDTLNSWGNTES